MKYDNDNLRISQYDDFSDEETSFPIIKLKEAEKIEKIENVKEAEEVEEFENGKEAGEAKDVKETEKVKESDDVKEAIKVSTLPKKFFVLEDPTIDLHEYKEEIIRKLISLKAKFKKINFEKNNLQKEIEFLKNDLEKEKEISKTKCFTLSSKHLKEIKEINYNVKRIINDRNMREKRNDLIFGLSLLLIAVVSLIFLFLIIYYGSDCSDTISDIFTCPNPFF